MRVFVIRHEIFESGRAYPAVAHEFIGKTPAEAEQYYNAHLQYDRFFRECNGLRGNFQGTLPCSGVVTSGWKEI